MLMLECKSIPVISQTSRKERCLLQLSNLSIVSATVLYLYYFLKNDNVLFLKSGSGSLNSFFKEDCFLQTSGF